MSRWVCLFSGYVQLAIVLENSHCCQWEFCRNYVFILFSSVSVSQPLVLDKDGKKMLEKTHKRNENYTKTPKYVFLCRFINPLNKGGWLLFHCQWTSLPFCCFCSFLFLCLTFIITNVPEKQGTLERSRSSTSSGHIQKRLKLILKSLNQL